MKYYDALFKCRLCGEKFVASETTSWQVAMNAVLYAAGIGGKPTPNGPALTDIHVCTGGGYGIADFLGFKESAHPFDEDDEEE